MINEWDIVDEFDKPKDIKEFTNEININEIENIDIKELRNEINKIINICLFPFEYITIYLEENYISFLSYNFL